MRMRIKDFGCLKFLLLLSVALGVGCSAKKPASTLSAPQAAAPPIQTTSAAKPRTVAKANPPAPIKPATPKIEAKKVEPNKVEPKSAEPKPDPVDEVIKTAEKEYQAGEIEYNEGHKEAAKQHFDKAFNLLLGSPTSV